MDKIFINTNIFLDMYRSNFEKSPAIIMTFLYDNKNYLITTEQSINEFDCNRYSILKKQLDTFQNNTNIGKDSTSFLRSLTSYKNYKNSIEEFNKQRKSVIDEIQEKINSLENDEIFNKFKGLCNNDNTIKSSNKIIDSAYKRKISGNPPTSDKYTCGDEIIWESLLSYGIENHNNLIIVSNDKTFTDNEEFLIQEYKNKTNGTLTICSNISTAYHNIGIEISNEAKEAEENLTWTDIIIAALSNLGGEAALTDIYKEASNILYYHNCSTKMKNNAKESTIRGILQRFSSDSNSYNGKMDLFHQISDGIWSLRDI